MGGLGPTLVAEGDFVYRLRYTLMAYPLQRCQASPAVQLQPWSVAERSERSRPRLRRRSLHVGLPYKVTVLYILI